MQKTEVQHYVLERYPGVMVADAWGEQAFFYNPERRLPRGVYFATVKDEDGNNDKASELGRDDVFRLSFGISKPSYEKAFGKTPARPLAGGVVRTGHDFSRLNMLLPHPVYAWMAWVCVLNPDQDMIRQLQPLLDESHGLAVQKYVKRIRP